MGKQIHKFSNIVPACYHSFQKTCTKEVQIQLVRMNGKTMTKINANLSFETMKMESY